MAAMRTTHVGRDVGAVETRGVKESVCKGAALGAVEGAPMIRAARRRRPRRYTGLEPDLA
jgi:hypothetical protein